MPLGFWVLASVYIHLSGVLRERAANMTLRCCYVAWSKQQQRTCMTGDLKERHVFVMCNNQFLRKFTNSDFSLCKHSTAHFT